MKKFHILFGIGIFFTLISCSLFNRQNSTSSEEIIKPPSEITDSETNSETISSDEEYGVKILNNLNNIIEMPLFIGPPSSGQMAELPIFEGPRPRIFIKVSNLDPANISVKEMKFSSLVEFKILTQGKDSATIESVDVLEDQVYCIIIGDPMKMTIEQSHYCFRNDNPDIVNTDNSVEESIELTCPDGIREKVENSDFSDFIPGASFENCDFHDLSFTRVDLSGIDFENVDFSKADLRKTIFDNSNLQGTNFDDADLSDASFINANLDYANLLPKSMSADFSGASFAYTTVDLDSFTSQATYTDIDFSSTILYLRDIKNPEDIVVKDNKLYILDANGWEKSTYIISLNPLSVKIIEWDGYYTFPTQNGYFALYEIIWRSEYGFRFYNLEGDLTSDIAIQLPEEVDISTDLYLSPDGNKILWEMESSNQFVIYNFITGEFSLLDVSSSSNISGWNPSSNILAYSDGNIFIFIDIDTKEEIGVIRKGGDLQWISDDQVVIEEPSYSENLVVTIWDTNTLNLQYSYEGEPTHTAGLSNVYVRPENYIYINEGMTIVAVNTITFEETLIELDLNPDRIYVGSNLHEILLERNNYYHIENIGAYFSE